VRIEFTNLSIEEVETAFASYGDRFLPILSLRQAAELAHISPNTLKRQISEGRYRNCVVRRKPLLVWRNRFVVELFKRKTL
jgi:hypothetical protein